MKIYYKRTFWQWLTRKPRPYGIFKWVPDEIENNSEKIITPDSSPRVGRWIRLKEKLPWYKKLFKVKYEWFGADS